MEALDYFAKAIQKRAAVIIIEIDGLSVIAAAGDMINSAREFDS